MLEVDPFSGTANIPRNNKVAWGTRVHSSEEEPHTYDMTGSAIARGNFFATGGGSGGHYAVGAPKADRLRGRVYLCRDCFGGGGGIGRVDSGVQEVQGEQFGSRFGQALAAVDVNGDGFDDLVVGAPLYTDEEKRVGCAPFYFIHELRDIALFVIVS